MVAALLLALAVQAAPPVDEARLIVWAKSCARATHEKALVAGGGRIGFEELVHIYHFALAAVARSPVEGRFADRIQIYRIAPTDPPLAPETVDAVAAACAREAPSSTGAVVGALPADELARNTLCFAIASTLGGIANVYRAHETDDAPQRQWQAQQLRFQRRLAALPKAQATYGSAAAFETALGRALLASVPTGRIDRLGALCVALPG